MAGRINSLIERVLHKRRVRRWGTAVERSETMDLVALRALRGRTQEIRRRLDKVLFVAEGRLALPLIGSNAIQRPMRSDWAYRPELWRGPLFPAGRAGIKTKSRLGSEVTVHHDCKISELTIRQVRNTREGDLAPLGLRIDVFRFDGNFLSLVIDLPVSAVEGITKRHLIGLTTEIETEHPTKITARLNIKHGPNSEQIIREIPAGENQSVIEFDLDALEMNEKRCEKAWVDLIFEDPEMNQFLVRDITLTRRLRAEV